jgi:AhpD family alkylhydroperoxidase
VLSPIRWWGRIPLVFYLVSMFVGYLERKRSPLDPVLRALVSARIAQMCLCEFCVDITSMKLAERTGSAESSSPSPLAPEPAVQRRRTSGAGVCRSRQPYAANRRRCAARQAHGAI